jgi:hypothetical protein
MCGKSRPGKLANPYAVSSRPFFNLTFASCVSDQTPPGRNFHSVNNQFMRTASLILCLCMLFKSKAQDTPVNKVKIELHVEALGRQHLHKPFGSSASMPHLIKSNRQQTTALPINFDSVSDNPFRHGAMYLALRSVSQFRNQLILKADLYGEYRGFSYGTFNSKNNLVLYPVFELNGRDTLSLNKEKLIVTGKLGQFINEQLAEGLWVYNIDLQGVQLGLNYRNTSLLFTNYGDLYSAIGLNTDDLREFSIEQSSRNDSGRTGISWTIAAPPYNPARYHSFFNIYGSLKIRESRLYAQFGFTPVYGNQFNTKGVAKQTAFVAGAENKLIAGKFRLNNKVEIRYYGAACNIFHFDPAFRFRDSAANQMELYANTTGPYLYPLRKFDTPFSQWAVFTEYSGYNVAAFTLLGNAIFQLNGKLHFALDYDINVIAARSAEIFNSVPSSPRSFFTYPFFRSSVLYKPMEGLHISVFVTNKSMNLDLSYPTHYLHKKPFVGFEMYCKL